MPVWLDEGMAVYYSGIYESGGTPAVSDPAPGVYLQTGPGRSNSVMFEDDLVWREFLPKTTEFLTATRLTFTASGPALMGPVGRESLYAAKRNYAAAWLLVRMLMADASPHARHFRELVATPDPGAVRREALPKLYRP